MIVTSAEALMISASSIGTIACAMEKATPPTKITEEKRDGIWWFEQMCGSPKPYKILIILHASAFCDFILSDENVLITTIWRSFYRFWKAELIIASSFERSSLFSISTVSILLSWKCATMKSPVSLPSYHGWHLPFLFHHAPDDGRNFSHRHPSEWEWFFWCLYFPRLFKKECLNNHWKSVQFILLGKYSRRWMWKLGGMLGITLVATRTTVSAFNNFSAWCTMQMCRF